MTLVAVLAIGCSAPSPIPSSPVGPVAAPSLAPSPSPQPGRSARNRSGTRTARVGAVLSLSGPARTFGTSQRNALEQAADDFNSGTLPGPRFQLVVEDDASDRGQGVQAFQKLINQDHVVAILGPTLSSVAYGTDPLAQQAGVPVVAVSNTAGGITEMGDCIFRASLTEAQIAPQTAAAVLAHAAARRPALLTARDDAGAVSVAQAYRGKLKASGLRPVANQTYGRDDQDLSGPIQAIQAAQPDVVFVAAPARDAARIVGGLRAAGLQSVPIVAGGGFAAPPVLRQMGAAAEGLVVGTAWSPAAANARAQDFVKRYQARYGTEPDQLATQAYAGLTILAEGMRSAKSIMDQRAIREALTHLQNVDTVLGPFSFTDTREAQHPAAILVVRDGKLVPYP